MDFEQLSILNHKKIKEDTIIWYPEVMEKLCYYPYPNHPKGCPNKEKCNNLDVPNFGDIKELGRFSHYYLICIEFDFKKYKEIRKIENPSFFNTEERLKCLLYWQGSLKKIIKDYIERIRSINAYPFYVLGCGSGFRLSFQEEVASMEAVGINVFSTLKLNKIKFEIKPKNRIILCNLLCSKKKISFKKETLEKWVK